ncbi:hypothetical protein ACER0C_017967 [Sarotherodon galilaeus]
MAEDGWILMSLCLMLMIPTADFCYAVPTTEIYILKRLGEDATLPCLNMNAIQENCSSIKWMSFGRQVLEISPEATGEKGQKYSDRLSITANCSLVVKKVTAEDAGHYYCQQYKSEIQGPVVQTVVDLSVVNITEQKYPDGTVSGMECSVVTNGIGCHYSLTWERDHNVDPLLVGVDCYASVHFMDSAYSSKNNSMKCKAMNRVTGEEHLFTFSPQPSEDTKTEPTKSASSTEGTTEPIKLSTAVTDASDDKTGETKSTTKKPTRNTENSTESFRAISNPITHADVKGSGRFIIVSVVSAALLITVVTLVIWIRTKGKKRQMEYVIHQNENEDDAAMNYENPRDSFSVRLY